MSQMWAGEPDGDNHVPSVRYEFNWRVAVFWKGSAAEYYGSPADFCGGPVGLGPSAEPHRQPVWCRAGHCRTGAGCGQHFCAQSIRMAFPGR